MLRFPSRAIGARAISAAPSASSFFACAALFNGARFAPAAPAAPLPPFVSTRKAGIAGETGAPVDIAAFSPLPPSAVAKLPEVDRIWLRIDGAHRQRLEAFAPGKFNATQALAARTEGIKKHNASDEHCSTAKVQPKIGAAVKAFVAAAGKDVVTLFQTYDELSLLLKALEREREILQLDIWGYNDTINLGLKFYSADKINAAKKNREAAQRKLADNQALFMEQCGAAFSTSVMNDMLNLLRIHFSKTGDGNARELGVQLLDDLSLFRVPFDAETQLLMRNLVFGDMPHDDSGLLFEMVESSVGGNVSVQQVGFGKSASEWSPEMDKIADETLHVIAARFQTPYSPELVKLRKVETHPGLQRSVD